MSKQTDEKRLKVNLLFKILVTVFIPLIILVAFCIASINKVGRDMSDKLTQGELENLTYTIQSQLNSLNDGEFTYDGAVLSKGDYSITENSQILDDFKANTGVDVTLIWGNKRVASTITDSSGNRVVNTTISDTAYDGIKKNHTYFDDNVDVQGEAFYGYYELINEQSDGNEFIIFTGKDTASVHSIYMGVLRFNIILMLGIAFLIVVLISAVVGKIAKSIERSVECLDRVAEGELNIQIDEKLLRRGDEVGNIARAIQDLMEKFKGLVLNIIDSSQEMNEFSGKFKENFDVINNSIDNVNIAVEEIATGATSQANETQDVTEKMVTMGNALSGTNANVEQLTVNTNEMKQKNAEVNATFDDLIKINNTTTESINHVYKQTNVTNQSALDIRTAVDMISDIASQTNLLSLNASIEAARAGEHGRGFAVVAEEIRKLADQSQESVQKIEAIIENLINNSNTSVDIMDKVIEEMTHQSEKLTDTQSVFGRLNNNINDVVLAIESISSEVTSIDQAKESVLTSLESLSAISEENAAGTEETSATMNEVGQVVRECNDSVKNLIELAGSLNESVSKFKL